MCRRTVRKMHRLPVLCIDFDGVILNRTGRFIVPHRIEGYMQPGARQAIELLMNKYEVIVHSCRCSTEYGAAAIEHWLNNNGIIVSSVARSKPLADVYIDDKALRHVSWLDTLKAIDEPLATGFEPQC